MSRKDLQTSELRPILDHLPTGELATKVDDVLDHRYQREPAPKKPTIWQRIKSIWSK